MALYSIGDLITFQYPAIYQQGTRAHDRNPLVLVLHPLWENTVHGLNFNYLSDDETNMVRMFIDPSFHLKYAENLAKKNPNLAKELDHFVGQASLTKIASPHGFYNVVIRPFIITRGWDPYRRYAPLKMTNVRVIQRSKVMTGESSFWQFGTDRMRDRRGKSELDILKDLARREGQTPGLGEPRTPENQPLTPTEKRFVQRLQGNALALFRNYKRRFDAFRGPRVPTWRRR